MILVWLFIVDWDLSRVIIFDKNSKFLLDFWQAIFRSLNIKILIITIYHSQANKQFEQINQMIEIALRYLISKNFDVNWVIIVFSFQFEFNNALNTFIDQTFNQLKFEFTSRNLIMLILTNHIIDQSSKLNLLQSTIWFIYVCIKIISYLINLTKSFSINTSNRFWSSNE